MCIKLAILVGIDLVLTAFECFIDFLVFARVIALAVLTTVDGLGAALEDIVTVAVAVGILDSYMLVDKLLFIGRLNLQVAF